jgi:hypothetical protein
MKKLYCILALASVVGLVGALQLPTAITASAAEPGKRVHIPRIDKQGGWSTWIQVQNVGIERTGAIAFFWEGYSGLCPSNDPGPMGHACMSIPENGVWTLRSQIPTAAYSAIIYSVDSSDFQDACADADLTTAADWNTWREDYEGTGQPLAVTVNRVGPDDFGTTVSSTYVGVDETMEGNGSPYGYFAPYLMKGYHDLDTEMTIQNSGRYCVSIWIYYREQEGCKLSYAQHIQQLAPGEAVRVRVPRVPELGGDDAWLGSAYITAGQPLGIVVDQTSFEPLSTGQDMLLTYLAHPYKNSEDTVFYADFIYREWSGWDVGIQVQNLTQHSLPTFVTVEFMDNSGDHLFSLGDWICANSSATFYLPAIIDLGMNYVGAAVIHSRSEPIFAVVDLKHPATRQGGSYNAHAKNEQEAVTDIALPSLAREYQGVTSLIAIRNNSDNNAIRLVVEISDETGRVVTRLPIFWLPPRHLKTIDLANIGSLIPGFVGAGRVRIVGNGGPTDAMLSAVVVQQGTGPGDITAIYEGIAVIE